MFLFDLEDGLSRRVEGSANTSSSPAHGTTTGNVKSLCAGARPCRITLPVSYRYVCMSLTRESCEPNDFVLRPISTVGGEGKKVAKGAHIKSVHPATVTNSPETEFPGISLLQARGKQLRNRVYRPSLLCLCGSDTIGQIRKLSEGAFVA
jgi:hypothetical protein